MTARACDVVLRAPSRATVTRVDLETGDLEGLPTARAGDELRVRLEFPSHGAHLLLLEDAPRPRRSDTPVVDLDLEGKWHCGLVGGSLNVLRLDRFRFGVGDVPAAGAPWVTTKPLVNVFQDLGAAWPGEVELKPIFGAPPRVCLKLPLTAWYTTDFDVRHLPRTALVCIETLALTEHWDLWLNGHAVAQDAFRPRRRWSNDNCEANVTALLQPGQNTLTVRVSATHSWDGLVDAIYLLGEFAVLHDDAGRPVLDKPPEWIRWSERHSAGFPYYSGSFTLRRSLALAAPPGAFRLRLPDDELMYAGVAELTLDGRPLGVRAWAPYVWDVPSGAVHDGVSQVTLTLTTTLVEQLEGKRYDPKTRRVMPVTHPPL
jgi:hypothetical protein